MEQTYEDYSMDDKTCEDCGEYLPDPVYELRDQGFEAITYCKCGATYNG
jgi:hypothetical protein